MVMMTLKRGIIFLLIIYFTTGNAIAAPDQVVVNSADWQDVYSGALYASLEGIPAKFLIQGEQAPFMITTLEKTRRNVLLIESATNPFTFGYKSDLEAAYFNVEGINNSGISLNIDLAKRIQTKKFIVLDDSYGYNAISVAPYAIKNNYFVLLANNKNGDELYSFLKSIQVEKLIIYGYLDNDLKQKLTEFGPEIINKGNRFDNNLEMVKRFGHAKQIIFTNGEFIESEIMSGKEPVIFVGKENVPDQVIDYIKTNDIKTGVIIGNDLVGSSHLIKEATNITIFLKFGQGGNTGSSEVKALDIFPIPVYDTKINVRSIQYNSETKSLEVTYENNGNIGTYFRSSIELFSSGTRITTVGDVDPVFVNRGNIITISYNKDINGQDLKSKITILFGEFPRSLDRILHMELPVEHISIKDNSIFNISGATYEVETHKLKIGLKNTGDVPAYGKTQITLIVYGEEKVLTQDKPMYLDQGASGEAVFITTLSETNIEENPRVKIHLNYGERESALTKVLEDNFDLKTKSASSNIIIVMLFVVIVIGILYYSRIRKNKIPPPEQKEESGKQE
jgi:archaellum component FlaF (FlaF/FlaG flagellin family)